MACSSTPLALVSEPRFAEALDELNSHVVTETESMVIRHAVLAPGDATPWHTDTCRRMTVVVRGDRLAIEYRDDGAIEEFAVTPGSVDWDEPEPRVHRAINCGSEPFEEIVTFFRDDGGVEPQPVGLEPQPAA